MCSTEEKLGVQSIWWLLHWGWGLRRLKHTAKTNQLNPNPSIQPYLLTIMENTNKVFLYCPLYLIQGKIQFHRLSISNVNFSGIISSTRDLFKSHLNSRLLHAKMGIATSFSLQRFTQRSEKPSLQALQEGSIQFLFSLSASIIFLCGWTCSEFQSYCSSPMFEAKITVVRFFENKVSKWLPIALCFFKCPRPITWYRLGNGEHSTYEKAI